MNKDHYTIFLNAREIFENTQEEIKQNIEQFSMIQRQSYELEQELNNILENKHMFPYDLAYIRSYEETKAKLNGMYNECKDLIKILSALQKRAEQDLHDYIEARENLINEDEKNYVELREIEKKY
ncbi:MAG: hypothetical protein QW303_05260 [Nitrososphaerota archaeon]